MIAYKLFRKLKDNSLRSLFINKTNILPLNKWLNAKTYPTKGFKIRHGWHSCPKPNAPHLSLKNRQWYKIEIQNFKTLLKPKNQGGKWYIAKKIKILKPVSNLKENE